MLKKEYRLKKNKEFRQIYAGGRSAAAGTVVLYMMQKNDGALPKVGFSVSKKVGNSVVRNTCRRRLREAVRPLLRDMQPGTRYIFIGRNALVHADFSRIQKDVAKVLKRLECREK
ncbi:MAG: ribonuclease P protein component [Peptococcaceae bacterium]|nr:ribonuclease P protein component [Peptococcaceae bacterium]